MASSFRQRLRDLALERARRLAEALVERAGRSPAVDVIPKRSQRAAVAPITSPRSSRTPQPTTIVARRSPPATVLNAGATRKSAKRAPKHDDAEAADRALCLARHLHLQLRRRGAAVFGPSPFDDATTEHDTEAVRAMRIGSRRLRAFVEVSAPWLGRKTTRRLRRDLRAITRALGPLREVDVLAGSLVRLQSEAVDVPTSIAIEHMLESIAPEHRRLRRRAAKAIARIDRTRLARDFRSATSAVLLRLIEDDGSLQTTAWGLLAPRVTWAFAPPIPTTLDDLEAVHETRIRCKRLRYSLELLEPAFEDGDRTVRRALKQTQVAIGNARDARQIADVVAAEHNALLQRGRVALADALLGLRQQLETEAIACEATVVPALCELQRADVPSRGQAALAPAVTYKYPLPSHVGQ